MKPQLLTLLLILALPFTGHTASEWTITKKHRVIQEASIQPSNVPIGTKISRLTFTTLRGDTHNLDTLTAQGPVVFAFLATECPVAQRYTMRLKRLHAEFAAQTNTTFVGSLRQRKRFRRRGGKLRRQGRPSVPRREGYNRQTRTCSRRDHDSTSPSLLIQPAQSVTAVPSTITATSHASNTITYETRSSQRTPIPLSLCKRCQRSDARSISPKPVSPQRSPTASTSHPVLQKNCQTCHRHGEVAPFTLIDYSDAKAWATEIAEYTQAGLMPPWKPASGYGDFKNARQLTDTEIQMIAHWVEAGAPAGDLNAVPPAPEFPEGWALGEPDWIAEMPVEYESNPKAQTNIGSSLSPPTSKRTCTFNPSMCNPAIGKPCITSSPI